MAISYPKASLLFFFVLVFISLNPFAGAQVGDSSLQLMTTEGLEWPSTMSLHDDFDVEEGIDSGLVDRRSLYWNTRRTYYISYGALSANRIPCPPRSGRSYYTHNCYSTSGPAHPYTRGCSAITRCRG